MTKHEGYGIVLGKTGTPLDLRIWNRHCRLVLGREIAVGEYLTPMEWALLGFKRCADAKVRKQ